MHGVCIHGNVYTRVGRFKILFTHLHITYYTYGNGLCIYKIIIIICSAYIYAFVFDANTLNNNIDSVNLGTARASI